MTSFQRFFSPDTKIINPKGDVLPIDAALEGVDVLAFYFSAHWYVFHFNDEIGVLPVENLLLNLLNIIKN